MEQVAARQRNPEHRLDDVANGAVIRETNFFCGVHKMATTEKEKGDVRRHRRLKSLNMKANPNYTALKMS